MKKTLLGFVAAATLLSFAAPVFAADEGAAPAEKPAKKSKKKGKKGDDAAPAADGAAADAPKK
jgi:hypothetical protein